MGWFLSRSLFLFTKKFDNFSIINSKYIYLSNLFLYIFSKIYLYIIKFKIIFKYNYRLILYYYEQSNSKNY